MNAHQSVTFWLFALIGPLGILAHAVGLDAFALATLLLLLVLDRLVLDGAHGTLRARLHMFLVIGAVGLAILVRERVVDLLPR